jgi:hypothetical protein
MRTRTAWGVLRGPSRRWWGQLVPGRRGVIYRPAVLVALILASLVPAAASADTCPNADIRAQQHSTYLPECRAYELVSPAQKFGFDTGDAIGVPFVTTSAGGDRVSYFTHNAFTGAKRGAGNTVIGTRGADGWAAALITPPPGPVVGALSAMASVGTSEDGLTSALYDATSEFGQLLAIGVDGTVKVVATGTLPQNGFDDQPGVPTFEQISSDGRHIVFYDSDHLVPIQGDPDTEGHAILYDWADDGANGGAGTLRVVNVNDDGTLISTDPAALGRAQPLTTFGSTPPDFRQAISQDGSRIFFQNPSVAGATGGPVYLRENGTHTVQVSAPDPGHVPATAFRYLDASADGSKVFFWADGQLTDDAAADGGIYGYDVAAQHLSFLASVPSGLSGSDATAMASDDGVGQRDRHEPRSERYRPVPAGQRLPDRQPKRRRRPLPGVPRRRTGLPLRRGDR